MLKAKLLSSPIEEIANTVTHGFGLFLSIIGFIILVWLASTGGGAWHITGSVIYGSSLVILYAASTFYHGATSPKLKQTLQIVDHCCIYLLIAGSYTPITLIVLRGAFGQSLFAFVWAFAVAGILLKVFFGKRFMIASVFSYLLMGWIGVVAIQPLFAALGFMPIALIVAGGIAYSLGVIFFAWKGFRHHHAIWHLFVLAGSICHFLAIAIYVIPYAVKV
ncbi:MAG TPA: hemolysin III family protein [Pyrinomonadaceae bacterium]|jgi:hemolysin III